ncbi:MAG: single-stranded DNA-binding protein [bacterium]|nr:single-stranded DNA-binding protein [bacterium]
MLELNKVLLVGNLTRDPEVRYLPSGQAVADLGVALNRRWFDRATGEKREETVFLDVTAWEKTAEFCGKYLQKGRAIFVEGRLKMDTWEDKQGGGRRSKLSVVAERIQFADSRPQGAEAPAGQGAAGPSGSDFRPPVAAQGAAPLRQAAPFPSEEESPASASNGNTEDDLPF